jgi:predicted RND superfamily exporter protein
MDRDLQIASLVAFLLVLGYQILHFRQALAVFMVLLPLGLGVLWTYGFAGAAFGVLNVLTAFIGAITMGLGNDHGLHLLGRLKSELHAGRPPEEAVRITFGSTGRAALTSAMTTMVGFLGLSISQFRVFREFGIIAAVGVLLTVFAYLVLLPALLSLAWRFGWRPTMARGEVTSPLVGLVQRHTRGILVGAAVAAVACAFAVPRLAFNYDFNAMQNSDLPSFRLDEKVNRLLGYSQTPVVVLTDSVAEEQRATQALRQRQAALGEHSTLDFIVSGGDLVPAGQEEKQPIIAAIGGLLRIRARA